MIYLLLKGRLGNQLFQYAAVKTLTDEKGFRLYFGGSENYLHSFQLGNLEIGQEKISRLSKSSEKFNFLIKKIFVRKFSPQRQQDPEGVSGEIFDPSFFEIKDYTLVNGFFSSEKYFRHNRNQILNWFQPKAVYIEQLRKLDALISAPPPQRVCIHIRRGDFKRMNNRFSKQGQGWQLPIAYYKAVVQELPKDLFYIVVSDEPDFAEEALDFIPNKIIIRGNAAVVDMFLMTKCRFNVIANSTFSWWGAWLNEIPGKIVFSPKYHIGWAKGFWYPADIQVPEWNYIDVLSLL